MERNALPPFHSTLHAARSIGTPLVDVKSDVHPQAFNVLCCGFGIAVLGLAALGANLRSCTVLGVMPVDHASPVHHAGSTGA